MQLAGDLRSEGRAQSTLTPFHERLWAEELVSRGGAGTRRLARALTDARVDLNPHQLEAAAFALDSLARGGCLLADEVGLGKTIEAGLVITQLLAEGRSKILILAPATLRAQWQTELKEKFDVDALLVDARLRGPGNPFDQHVPVISSHPFGANRSDQLAQVAWDLVVIDEAHRLRNAHRPGHKTGQALKLALRQRPMLLLTATPLQNDLSELFGLLSLLDEQILGPEAAFKARYPRDERGDLSDAAASELKGRLANVVHRTLRRQVREYVRYTARRSVVEDFAPLPEEQALYERVSEYLRRTEAAAIEPGKRTLLTLVYRKLLASSTYAIAPTLHKLAAGLERRVQALKAGVKPGTLVELDELSQYTEEAEEWGDEPARAAALERLEAEVFELKAYAAEADSIRVNAKGEALTRALARVFSVSRGQKWPEKAVIFTESRRTQEYLRTLLEERGYRGQVSVLSGDASTPEERRALVEEFRDRTQILLSTEAGAEGLNLQFCNVVVNYDLPWNPQRVEQRIGRCHRYGQQRDVLVLNFLNRQNAADARLFELLEKKLSLFDGVFGASDEILGALESGVDFERRVLDIYQSCRRPEEIDAAFDKLRSDLEQRIDQRMMETRSLLIERFDGDVRRRLKLAGEQVQEAFAERASGARALTTSVLGRGATDRAHVAQAASAVRERGQTGVSYLALDAAGLPSRLAHLAGGDGWWFVYRFELSGLKPEDRLVHVILLRKQERFLALSVEDAAHFVRLEAREEPLRQPPPISVAQAQESALNAARDALLRAAERRGALELDEAKERAARYAEDCLMEPRELAERSRVQWEMARAELAGLEDGPERAKKRAAIDRLEREYRRRLSAVRSAEEQRYAEKDRTLAALTLRAKVNVQRALIASAYFWLS